MNSPLPARFALDDTARPEYLRLALGLGLAVYSGYLDAYRIGYVFDFVKAATGGSTLQQLGVFLRLDDFYVLIRRRAKGRDAARI